ncbi:MAG: magnesium transporter [Acidobacteria bacterium]|nr:magnesium transporter [Acidobacteriota bacterium]
MRPAPLTAANLHDPILPLVRPVPVTLVATQTIAEALPVVRASITTSDIHYFYVVDDERRLVGIVPARHLLAALPEQRVSEVMITDVVAIPSWATVLIASEYFATRKLLAFPVIQDNGELVGVVDISLFTHEVIDLARRTYDDIFQLLGVHATAMRTPWTSFRDRFPWLLSNIAGGLICALIAAQFEVLLDNIVVLALFIPIVLALAESVSMQSATLTLQTLSDDSLKPRRIVSALWKEARTAALLGAACGGVVAMVVIAWRRDVSGATVIGGAIAASIVTACLFGVLWPTVIRALKADPRIAAGPLVLASTDVATLLFYLGLGAALFG